MRVITDFRSNLLPDFYDAEGKCTDGLTKKAEVRRAKFREEQLWGSHTFRAGPVYADIRFRFPG